MDYHSMLSSRRRKVLEKRMIDVALCLASLPVTLPLGILVAVIIRLGDGGPTIFRQKRIGFNEAEFSILKFRTMRSSGPEESDRTRITPLGRLLRKTSLDELPQIVNVIRGDMALVGPRPLFTNYIGAYTERERLRHTVRPGITGLAQTSGRNSLRWNDRLELDVRYVEGLSISKDLSILWKTFRNVTRSNDVALVPRDTGEPLDIERNYPKSGKMQIRRFNLLDVELRVKWMQDQRVRNFMQFSSNISVETTREWYRRVSVNLWRDDFVLCDNETGQVVAMMGLKSESEGTQGTLYVFVDPEMQRRGYGRLAVRLLLLWAAQSRYDVIHLTVDGNNTPAIRIYEELGFALISSTAENRRHYEFVVLE